MDPNGLGMNIGYASQARQNRFTDAALHPSAQAVGGPMADPSWDALWGAMHAQEGVPYGDSLHASFGPALAGLHAAMTQRG